MPDTYSIQHGGSPLIVSMPHSGTVLPQVLAARMTAAAATLADTDWHIPQLYNFLDDMDVTVLSANYSRYLVDLNRSPSGAALYPGQSETEICPTSSFAGEPLYRPGQELAAEEIPARVASHWQPYHKRLAAEISRVKSEHGFALLWDAHSIQSRVPRFFEGRLPDLNLGTAGGQSCDSDLAAKLVKIMAGSDQFSTVCNGRFKGGAITRQYGDPAASVHAVQMEIAQSSYMDENPGFRFEEHKADVLRPVLREMIVAMQTYGGA